MVCDDREVRQQFSLCFRAQHHGGRGCHHRPGDQRVDDRCRPTFIAMLSRMTEPPACQVRLDGSLTRSQGPAEPRVRPVILDGRIALSIWATCRAVGRADGRLGRRSEPGRRSLCSASTTCLPSGSPPSSTTAWRRWPSFARNLRRDQRRSRCTASSPPG